MEFQNQKVCAQFHVKGDYAPLFDRDWYLLFNIDFNEIFTNYFCDSANVASVNKITDVSQRAQNVANELKM